jgi:hypothetical protein
LQTIKVLHSPIIYRKLNNPIKLLVKGGKKSFESKYKYHLVSWLKVCSPISERGLWGTFREVVVVVMYMRESLGGKLLWMLNLVVLGAVVFY